MFSCLLKTMIIRLDQYNSVVISGYCWKSSCWKEVTHFHIVGDRLQKGRFVTQLIWMTGTIGNTSQTSTNWLVSQSLRDIWSHTNKKKHTHVCWMLDTSNLHYVDTANSSSFSFVCLMTKSLSYWVNPYDLKKQGGRKIFKRCMVESPPSNHSSCVVSKVIKTWLGNLWKYLCVVRKIYKSWKPMKPN